MPVRVFHGDDNDAFRLLIETTLPDEGGIEVVGGAGTADEVVAGVEREQPDVVLLDQLRRRASSSTACARPRPACAS